MTPQTRRWRTRGSLVAVAVLLVLSVVLIDAPAAAAPPIERSDATPVWQWPLEGERTITRAFEAPATPWSEGHRGIDAAAHQTQNVLAPADGVVFFAGVVVNRPVITLEHADGLLSSFEAVTPALAAGDAVERGQVIGTITTGPHCGSDCLHIGVRVRGEYVNPLIYFGGIDRAVLLPLAGPAMPADAPAGSSL